MAVIYTKGKKNLKYTGIDKVTHEFGNVLNTITSTAKSAANAIPNAYKRKAKGDARAELDNISRAFGSVRKYEQMYPDTAKRNRQLMKTAGYYPN